MGLLKKITKPLSKILDKIIPNEIKPALPFLSAAAPFMAPGIMGTSMLQRALMSGALNLGSQLSQEGSEGDFNPLSVALASGIGALSAPGTPSTVGGPANMYSTPGTPGAEEFLMGKAEAMDPGWMKSGTEMLGTGAKYLTKAAKTLQNEPFTKEGLMASAVPFSQGLADSAMITAQQALDEFNAGLEEGSDEWYDDNARRVAIRRAMEMAGHVEDDILSALAALGLKEGGRVGFKNAGLASLNPPQSMNKEETQWISRVSPTKEVDMINKIYEEGGHEALQAYLERNPDLTDKYIINADAMTGELSVVPNKVHEDFLDMEKIIMIDTGNNKAKGGRIGFENGGIGEYYQTFGKDRFLSEMFDEYGSLLSRGEGFFDKVDEEIATGKFPEPEKLKRFKKDYDDLQDQAEITMDRYESGYEDKLTEKDDIDRIKYYENKEKELEKREDAINERDAEITLNNLDASEITRTPDFQAWLKLYEAKDPRAKLHPYHDEFEDVLMSILPGRDKSYLQATDYDAWKKNGGRINKAEGGVPSVLPRGTEMDYRGGGMIPMGSKERADDVPARLSKNEFVMTADAVRAAGGGSVNVGAKRMYDLMHNLEARV